MPGLLNQVELIEAVDTMFKSGVPVIVFHELLEDDAMNYRTILENAGNEWEVSVLGPSKKYDILEKEEFYGLRVRRRVEENA
jgi:hypothetical protein